ncbi:MAG TPA: histone deacetylase family protein [Allosphingosinicella sp.]
MRIFHDPRQRLHAPSQELHNGSFTAFAEHPGRLDAMLAAVGPAEPPRDFGEGPLLRVHPAEYLGFLKSAWDDWRAAGRTGDTIPYVWPVVGRRPLDLSRIDARLGRYSYDASTPIAEHTWEATYWSAQSALAATQAVLDGERAAFALCRPPGHHAGADYMGGYCYVNAMAVAAQYAADAGRRVAILDIDYHHGNGTQDIFLERGDLFFASIHADPKTDYPFYWGHADETGTGEGKGATLNLPLPRGTTAEGFSAALDTALQAIARFGADMLLCSFGADTYAGDPISFFDIQKEDYPRIARRIAGLGLPTAIVMEGGYAVDALGANVAAFLSGFD